MNKSPEKGFKLVLKTVDSTNIILMDSKNELGMQNEQKNKHEKQKPKRRKKTTEMDEDFEESLTEAEKLKLFQFDAKVTRGKQKREEEFKESIENLISNKIEKYNEGVSQQLQKIANLLEEKNQTKNQQIIIIAANSKDSYEEEVIKKALIDPKTIVIEEAPKKVSIKEEPDTYKLEVLKKIKMEESEKPKMLRKFRPPVRKRRRSVTPEKDCKVIETKQEIIDLNDSSTTESEGEASKGSKTGSALFEGSQKMAKLHHINAWFARSQKTWCLKELSVLVKMLTKNSLVSTFKCMATCCSYTTTDARNFEAHLRFHLKSKDNDQFLFFCPYCFFRGDKSRSKSGSSDPVEKLVHHYETYHANDAAQCGLCFYRSAEGHSVWEHMEECHPSKQKLIFETAMPKRTPNETVEKRHQGLRKGILPLVCTECPKNFYECESFENHLSRHSENPKTSASALRDFTIYSKKKDEFKIGFYECLHCRYGAKTHSEIRKHMQNHPTELLYACKRKKSKPEDDDSADSLLIVKLRERGDIQVNFYDKSQIELLKNDQDVKNIKK